MTPMFDDWRTRRRLRRELTKAKARFEVGYETGERSIDKLVELQREVNFRESLLLKRILEKAQRVGIEPPETTTWWADDSDSGLPPGEVTRWLTRVGQAGLNALIIEKRNKNWEFWIRVIAALTGLWRHHNRSYLGTKEVTVSKLSQNKQRLKCVVCE